MDIVYVFKESRKNNSEELRYSLRTLTNIPHGKVVLAGEMPAWVRNVHHIPVEQYGEKKDAVRRNLLAAVSDEAVSDDFILMNDDFFLMQPQTRIRPMHMGKMSDVIAIYDARYPDGSAYIDRMKLLYTKLDAAGKEPYSYELHMPIVLNKHKVRALYESGASVYQFRTCYANTYSIGGEYTEDVKIFLDARHNPSAYERDPRHYMSAQPFLSATGGSFERGLVGQVIREAFTEPSPYET